MTLKKYYLTVLALCSVCYMTGCTSSSIGIGNSGQQTALRQAARFNKLAEQSPEQQAMTFKLQAIEQLVNAEQNELAERSLAEDFKIVNLDTDQDHFKTILQAKIALAKQNPTLAKQYLREIWTPAKLPPALLSKFYTVRADIYLRSGELVESLRDRIQLSKHLNTPIEQQANNVIIWDTLMQLSNSTIQSLQSTNSSPELKAWLELAQTHKQYDLTPEELQAFMQNWRKKYAQHTAVSFLANNAPAEQVNNSDNNIIKTPRKVALMLPLQGAHAKSAQAIRDGFLAAFYAHKNDADKPRVQIYDTFVHSDLSDLYQQIVAEGADFIVGPLTKEEVDIVSSRLRAEIPILTLNTTQRSSNQDNILQFSLSPELEAKAVANKAWLDGHRTAVVIIPKSPWGKRMLTSFQDTWKNLGGKIIAVEEVTSQSNLTANIQKLLAINTSEARAQKLKKLGLKFTTEPRRRADIDMIFIATNAALARQVKPLLNYYFAGNIPAYASSSIYSGKPQPHLDQDLNGIKFCDMPWILDTSISSTDTYNTVSGLWPQDFEQYARLYALGLDAYKVALQIEQLTLRPGLGVAGMTGILTLDKQQIIQRKLLWASFKKGTPTVGGDY